MSRISVIIPCYNVASYIDRCIMSIVAQTAGIGNLEVICIDDASTDDTWNRLQRWEQRFPENILLIRHEVNRRQGAARNLGMQYASADWVTFVDADDWLEPDCLELLYEAAERYGVDVAVCGTGIDYADSLVYFQKEERENGADQYIQPKTEEEKKNMLLCKPLGEAPYAKIIRRDMLACHQILFLEGLAYEDNYWVPLLHAYTDKAYVVGKKLYHYFVNPQSTIHRKNESYHIDWITVQLAKWKDYTARGLMERYRRELECDLLYNAVCFMKTLVLQFDQPSFSCYQLEKQVIRQIVPDYRSHPYAALFQGTAGMLLEALYLPMDRSAFQEFTEAARQCYTSGKDIRQQGSPEPAKRLRIVLFYSETESFNFFTDQLAGELTKRGHEVCICDLEDTKDETVYSYRNLNRFLAKKVDVVICFDGLGTREEQFIEQWNRHEAVVIDILMDPPFRFHPTLERHSDRYCLFCCDQEHVAYVKKYFHREVPDVAFLPHAGTLLQENALAIPYEKRKYDILFSGSYVEPDSYMQKIGGLFPDDPESCRLYGYVYEALKKDCSLTVESAVVRTLSERGYTVSDTMLKTLLNRSLYVDWAIRMYHRGRVVSALAEHGFDLYLLGQGWECHPSAERKNVHRIAGQVPYRRTLDYMADAKINLNVMPWFKAGTHDRIFNTLLQHSVPLTDPSTWILDHFTDGVDIALYELDHLERLPGTVQELLKDGRKAKSIIQNGYEKVRREFTWTNCADQILETVTYAEKCVDGLGRSTG